MKTFCPASFAAAVENLLHEAAALASESDESAPDAAIVFPDAAGCASVWKRLREAEDMLSIAQRVDVTTRVHNGDVLFCVRPLPRSRQRNGDSPTDTTTSQYALRDGDYSA